MANSEFKTQRPFVTPEVSRSELLLASMLFGFLLGFGYFACLTVVAETRRTRRFSVYIVMCWVGLFASFGFSLMSWLVLDAVIPVDSIWVQFWILVFWALQLNCLLQILVNRVCILIPEAPKRFRLKLIVALIAVTINIAVFIIWIPARLQINDTWSKINHIWDRIEKCVFLLTDGYLNWLFITTVQMHLIDYGLTKYDRLLKFNKAMVLVSLSLDCLTIGLMSLPNGLVFTQCQSLGYLIKLEIEMSISQLIVKVATSTGIPTDLAIIDDSQEATRSNPLPVTFAHHRTTFGGTTELSVHTDVFTDHDGTSEYHNHLQGSKDRRRSLSPDRIHVEDAGVGQESASV